MPAGDDPHVGDLGYWAPDGDLVLYYGEVGYWAGIMRIGEIDGDMQAVAGSPVTSTRPSSSRPERSSTKSGHLQTVAHRTVRHILRLKALSNRRSRS